MGQACSYKIGHIAWTPRPRRSREVARDQFDLKQFHEVLKDGAMPLTLLQARIRERTAMVLRG